ncbi:hypothetical protein JKY79_03065 [Candidatus Babeliales bacterium]|nr:hypothetical protein [Candidatus Babeliales bacterium]
MAKLHPIQNKFTAGILSPRLHARSDAEAFNSGVEDSLNMVPLKHGPMQTRDGTVFARIIEGTFARVFPFQLTPDSVIGEGFSFVISDSGKAFVIGASGIVGGTELVVNGQFGGGLNGWTTNSSGSGSSVNWVAGKALLDGGTSPSSFAEITQQILVDTDVIHIASYTVEPIVRGITGIRKIRIGTSQFGAEIAEGTNTVQFDTLANPVVWVTIRINGVFPEGEEIGDFIIITETLRKITNVTLTNTNDSPIIFSHSYTATDIRNLQAEMTPSEDVMYITSATNPVSKLTYNAGTNVWAFGEVAFINQPASWVDNSYPSTVAFFQGRSWWGGARDKAETFWGSKSAEFENLTTGVTDANAMEHTINRRGRIRWMKGVRNLLIGTTSGEFIVTSEGAIVTPSDVGIEMQSANGSSNVQPTAIGNSVMYVSSDGRKVFVSTFKWTEDAWFGQDITFTAEHLTDGNKILDLAYAKNPENVIWMASENGQLLACTFEPSTGQMGWHRHETNGFVLDASVVEKAGMSIVTLVVIRKINGVDTLVVENMSSSIVLDSAVVINNDTPSADIVGVSALAGNTVTPVVDGAVHPDISLDLNGNGTLNYVGSVVQIGHSFTQEMITMPEDAGSEEGSGMGFRKRWNKIILRILSSAMPLINGKRPADRTPQTLMNTREASVTKDIEVSNLGYDDRAQISIVQDKPLKMTIVGRFGDMGQSNL